MRGGDGKFEEAFRAAGLDDGRNGRTPKTFTAADLMAEEMPPVSWALPGIVPEGVSILAGKPKIGKGWLVMAMQVAVSSGGVALGKVPVERGVCLYLALEDNPRRLQKRLSKLLAGSEVPSGLHMATEWPRLDEGGAEALEEWLSGHPNARLIVIDTLAKVRPRQRGQNVYAEDYAALEHLLPLAAEHSVAIIVVHHLRKMAAADPLDELSGSTGLSGGVDGVMVLKRDRGRADAYLHVTGREIEEEAELALRWDPDTAGWSIVGDATEYRTSEERQEVLKALEEAEGPMSVQEITDAVGGDYNATRQRLYQMGRAGELSTPGRGRYALPNTPNNPNEESRQGEADVRNARDVRSEG